MMRVIVCRLSTLIAGMMKAVRTAATRFVRWDWPVGAGREGPVPRLSIVHSHRWG
jgi:hypothetical protein